MTQKARIIEILERYGHIDNFFCIRTRLTLRLGMHIHLLRQAGWKIRTEELPSKNCIYYLVSKPAPTQLELV